MESLHVQVPKSSINAVGDYLHAEGPIEGKHYYFTTLPKI
jgi:hypothetical protein